MKKKKKYLPLYYEWMESGELPMDGLCYSFVAKRVHCKRQLSMMSPYGDLDDSYGYWGASDINGESLTYDDFMKQRANYFCPLRQTIVLFLAAMNDEL